MSVTDQATINAELHGTDGGERWMVGDYDGIPLHIRLAPDLVDRFRDGDAVGAEHVAAIQEAVTDKVERGTGEFGRQLPSGRGTLVIDVDATDLAG